MSFQRENISRTKGLEWLWTSRPTLETTRLGSNMFNILRQDAFQSRIFCPAKLSINSEGKIIFIFTRLQRFYILYTISQKATEECTPSEWETKAKKRE